MTTSSSGYTSSGRGSKRGDLLLVVALTLLALLLRAARLDFQPLWWDEGYSVWFARQPLGDMLRLTALDIHPPLYYAWLGAWSQVFGPGPVALRWFSVLAGVAAVPLIYLTGLWLAGRRVGLAAAVLLAINPLHIYYSQEVRMYALVTLWSLLALGLSGRWLGLRPRVKGEQRAAGWGWLAGYIAAMTLALYSQYYAGFMAAGLTLGGLVVLWRRRAGRERILAWLAAQGVVLLLTLPWILYAAPKLVPYVSQKIVYDADQPLGLLLYLARHLAAFSAGHLEGPLARLWPLGLLGVVLLALGLVRLAGRRPLEPGRKLLLAFLAIPLATVLGLGWLVNLAYPFFPERGERLMLLGLPVFLLLLAAAWIPPDPVTSKAQRLVLPPAQSRVPRLALVGLALLAGLSLAAFYIIPRYEDEDYRPLIDRVMQSGRAEDTVFAVFPWQVGYFWSYGRPDGPQPELSPNVEWMPEVAAALDEALQRGRVWFPMHLSLGGLLESAAEQHLAADNYQLANGWYSPSTRLSGWAAPPSVPDRAATTRAATFANGVRADASFVDRPLYADNDVLPITLALAGLAEPHVASLRLIGEDGRRWAQQDITTEQDGALRIGLLAPAGTPAGRYDLRLSLATAATVQALAVVEPAGGPATELVLGQVHLQAPATPPSAAALAIEQPADVTFGDAARLLGYSATAGPLLPGEDVTVNLFWQALPGAAGHDLSAFVQLLDPQGQLVVGWEGPPVAWHLTGDWQPDELVRSQHNLRLPATLPAGRYRVVAGLFDPASDQRLPAQWRSGPFNLLSQSAELATLGRVRTETREHVTTAPQPRVNTDASLARLARLVGYDLLGARVAPSGALDLTLYWQPSETTGERLKVFVHLLDSQGAIIGQSDSEPAAGERPTSSWLPDEFIADRHTVRVRDDATIGPATLVVGLYDPATGQRVPWVDADGQVLSDALALPSRVDISPRP